jgi:ABC-type transport system involved in cytochrome bd biosynthesis fused ATPase/permease subunit
MLVQVLLLDELTTFLDSDDAAIVLATVRAAVTSGDSVAAIWVTHRLEELHAADRVSYMDQGQIVVTGRPGAVLRHLRSLGAKI